VGFPEQVMRMVQGSGVKARGLASPPPSVREMGVLLPNNQRKHLAHPEGRAALRILLND